MSAAVATPTVAGAGLLDAFAGTRVLVVGEAMLDSYLHGSADRLSREAPVPIVALKARDDAPGGAANTAVNLAALGADVALLSVVGDDDEGQRLRAALDGHGVDHGAVLEVEGRATLAKHRVIAGDQILVRFDSGTTDAIDAATEDALIDRLEMLFPAADAVVVSDYDYGVVGPRLVAALGEQQRRAPRTLVVDARDLARHRSLRATAVKPNYGEACRLLGERERSDARVRARQIGSNGDRLLDITGARIAAVTVDTDGAFIFERDQPPYRTYARPQTHSRCAGAGDTFVSALTLALAAGAGTPAAAELASAAAAVVVEKDGTSTCTAAELRTSLSTGEKRIDDRDALAVRLGLERSRGRRIVFTNGCFDILHRGHVTYLNKAKALGDVLVVGVNSDSSVRRLKGPDRPINPLDDRIGVLEAMSCVDLVVPFDEDTPLELIRLVRPDIFTKGGDYSRERLPEADAVESAGGTVRILPYVEDRSTTRLIDRVRATGGPASSATKRVAVPATRR
ncbi:MAG: D-glycero-beta-D-manno-heptose 1-phosphate adenylyltransferase [Chloroflexota bacterium]